MLGMIGTSCRTYPLAPLTYYGHRLKAADSEHPGDDCEESRDIEGPRRVEEAPHVTEGWQSLADTTHVACEIVRSKDR